MSGDNLPLDDIGSQSYIAKNQLALLKTYACAIDIASKGAPYDKNALSQLEREEKKLERPRWQIHVGKRKIFWRPYELADIFSLLVPQVFNKASQLHALQRVTVTAIAVRSYRSENGHYPENLQALVPKYLPRVPIDSFDGKPIRYRKLAKGFKVWSVGGNEKDDSGMEARDWWRRGDLVWQSER